MAVEFISLTYPNLSTDIAPLPDAPADPAYLARYARSVEEAGFGYTLLPYGSSSFDPFTLGATVAAHTRTLKIIIALRPNTVYPTVAAKSLATLDQLSGGRVVVHLIAGGSDAEQAAEGDFLSKDDRYARLEEYIAILKRAWSSREPFDFAGRFYTFKRFSSAVAPVQASIPVSVGGSSGEAYRIGGLHGDIFGLWGEPLAETREQIDRIFAAAEAAGRKDRPQIWVTFRPILAETDELAWAKAHRILAALKTHHKSVTGAEPQNVGSQRLLEFAAKADVHDKALWFEPAAATGARGASTALVGSPDTVAEAILRYVDIGADLISIRGYDNLYDVIDYGRYLVPLVRAGLASRNHPVAVAASA
ncbi:LLM class flavin-dependent oxidoreductase [Shinella sp. CPCC 101442]|uniref:LLM class flavin-dependent oxidoreductase n=1 Tax=Shinella sp. CPCC 101442 TaxID=2932265 RepID=UPI0021528EEF|nr:LLM class flavin-dependent oxidoreductase [Shinella sp. CPCC 101442]MCR6502359.1 LLM class flavin-dependent oxidoreductase [Shinella sp. CPCC 101442]